MIVPFAVLVAPSALAASGSFVIDGIVPDAGATNLPDLFGNVKELGPLNSSTTKIGVIHNDAVPTLGLTNPNGQVDPRQAWLTTARDAGTQHDWLYFAWESDANSGSGFIADEFMQAPPPAACAYDTASAPSSSQPATRGPTAGPATSSSCGTSKATAATCTCAPGAAPHPTRPSERPHC